MSTLRPAHHTKHLPILLHPFKSSSFSISQRADGISNGTALWLGAQCLSLYLAYIIKPNHSTSRPRAIELGSGTGLTALALNSLGWDVLATDLPHVIATVLSDNINNNTNRLPFTSGRIQIRELDWTVYPDKWSWSNGHSITSIPTPCTSLHPLSPQTPANELLAPPFDIIYSADTVYDPALIEPLLRTIHALSTLSCNKSCAPPVYLCIERRDPALVDRLLADAKAVWQFNVERVPHKKLVKAMLRGGVQWEKHDWEGIEIWKLSLLLLPMSSTG
ncbi:hypothetical protein AMATHDRAFT_144554 [Amanita thiersii Skay4041]|uniref:Methyltransferase-domain-containing protein n=1 Tax=Amanita thiersii Skay4041 TaxID=703135 RepID=A0A2A9NKQ5_9AGAR|nr:hypothetical protein AMATHDRAFT_144554 [Amanita thiersii Skay4041]